MSPHIVPLTRNPLQRFAVLVLVILLASETVQNQEPQKATQNSPTIKADTALVIMTATTFDQSGRPVLNLEKSNFAISEDGVPQEISIFQREDVPVSVGILFDTSGSMVDKIDEVRDAVTHFIQTTNPADDLFLMRFSDQVELVQDFSADRRLLTHAVGRLRPGGSTALYDAIVRGLQQIQKGQHSKKALLIVTDGNDTSSQISFQQAVETARQSEVLIYCLGIGHGEHGSFGHLGGIDKDTVDADALLAFSDSTGGRTFLLQGPHHKKGVDQIDQACQSVVAELRKQYTLGYYPANRVMDGNYRRIRVQVKNGNNDFRVRTREGYYALPALFEPHPQP